jgi:predicted flap endonuclease-1-like 5' DNA nuclease
MNVRPYLDAWAEWSEQRNRPLIRSVFLLLKGDDRQSAVTVNCFLTTHEVKTHIMKGGSINMTKLSVIEGIGAIYEEKLKNANVKSVEDLLDIGSTRDGRSDLAESTDISEKLILRWVNHADLSRIKGIRGEYAELLEAAGVDTVPELAQRRPDNLYAKIVEVNETKKLVRKLPTESHVADWINQAKVLPRKVIY